MSTDIQAADAAPRSRSLRRATATPAQRSVEPPRQRRPALAALALLLVVGGALLAGLLAVRMDSREPVLAAARDIPPGTQITAEDLREVSVASEGLELIPVGAADQVVGAYAEVLIQGGSLLDQNVLTTEEPVGEDRAIVSVPLNPALTPGSTLEVGDLVQVVRVSGGTGSGRPQDLTEAVVLDVRTVAGDELGGAGSGAATLLVPSQAASAVVDAAGADLAGLAILERDQGPGADLQVAQ